MAKAAYNSGDKLTNERTGETHDYSRKGGVVFSGVFAPENAPAWARDREALWSEVEQRETRKNSQLAREIEIGLPHELTAEQREWLVKDYVRETFVRHGMVADVAIHAPAKGGDQRNHHAHILLTMREIGPEGFGEKMRELNSKAQLEEWREKWERLANRHLERHGHEARIDRRSLEAQGIDREPGTHEGVVATHMERRGERTERGNINREIGARNREREVLKDERDSLQKDLESQKESVDDFKQHQENEWQEKQEQRQEQRERRQEERLKAAQSVEPSIKGKTQQTLRTAERGLKRGADIGGRLADGMLKAVDSALDFFAGAPPPRSYSSAELASDPSARREHYAQRAQARGREEALDSWERQLQQSNQDYATLTTGEVRKLNLTDLENIKARGGEGIQELIREHVAEREKETRARQGRTRERDRDR